MSGAGEEVLGLAEQMEASSNHLETRVFGRDQGVRGLLRVTMAPTGGHPPADARLRGVHADAPGGGAEPPFA